MVSWAAGSVKQKHIFSIFGSFLLRKWRRCFPPKYRRLHRNGKQKTIIGIFTAVRTSNNLVWFQFHTVNNLMLQNLPAFAVWLFHKVIVPTEFESSYPTSHSAKTKRLCRGHERETLSSVPTKPQSERFKKIRTKLL